MTQRGLGPVDPAPDFDDGVLRIKPRDYVALARGNVIRLPLRQLALLAELSRAPGRVRTRADLYAAVWDGEAQSLTRVVDVTVAHLRARLAAAIPDRLYIHTHPRVGYRFNGEPAGDGSAEGAGSPESSAGSASPA